MTRVIAPVCLSLVMLMVGWVPPRNDKALDPDSMRSASGKEAVEIINKSLQSVRFDSLLPAADESTRYTHLTDEDFRLVAEEMDVEMAAIKAVVLIEAGSQMRGFWAPGVPVVNFDRSMFRRYRNAAPKRPSKGEKAPAGLTGYARSEWTQLVNARHINATGANMGTFWGMFQIGGFNYKLCGCKSIDEFVSLMSYSELEQLELFAAFITNTGMLKDLKAKNWSAFARKYNGPSYARRGYHTKMANAYAKFKKQAAEKTKPVLSK